MELGLLALWFALLVTLVLRMTLTASLSASYSQVCVVCLFFFLSAPLCFLL